MSRAALTPRLLMGLLAALLLAAIFPVRFASAGERVQVDSLRPGVHINVFWHPAEQAHATLLMFTGGDGGFGKMQNGWPASENFLARSAPLWTQEGLNVALFGRPSDMAQLSPEARVSDAHLQDIQSTINWIKTQSSAPIWLVGTSMGTLSTTAALVKLDDPQIAGGVLTSSIVSFKTTGAVPKQALDHIKRPVLVYHHQNDACQLCQPHEVPGILAGLKNAPVKKLMMVSGGSNPSGPVCQALHWHGFIGMEPQAVADISGWIRKPVN